MLAAAVAALPDPAVGEYYLVTVSGSGSVAALASLLLHSPLASVTRSLSFKLGKAAT